MIHIIGNIPPLRGATPTQTGNRYPRQVVGHDDIIGPVERDTVVRVRAADGLSPGSTPGG